MLISFHRIMFHKNVDRTKIFMHLQDLNSRKKLHSDFITQSKLCDHSYSQMFYTLALFKFLKLSKRISQWGTRNLKACAMTAVPSAAGLLLFCLWRQKISSKNGHLPCVPYECLYFGGATTIFFGCPIVYLKTISLLVVFRQI